MLIEAKFICIHAQRIDSSASLQVSGMEFCDEGMRCRWFIKVINEFYPYHLPSDAFALCPYRVCLKG